jgi:hypothetical protein
MQRKMTKKMSRTEFLFLGGTSIIFIIFAAIYFYRQRVLEKDGVFVVGRIIEIKNVENGYNHSIKYVLNMSEFWYNYKAITPIRDSLVFLNISMKHPGICRVIANVRVPRCFYPMSYSDSCWSKIPYCSTSPKNRND